MKLIRHPRAWRWSSYRATAGEEAPRFLTTDCHFHRERERARREYRKFVSRGKGIDVWADLRGGVILGSERFVERLEPLLRERASELEISRRERLAARPSLEELFGGLKDKRERDERIYQAVRVYGYTRKQVAETVGLSYSTVSAIAKRVAEAKKGEN